MPEVTHDHYLDVFERHPAGAAVLEDLIKKFTQSAVTDGGIDAVRLRLVQLVARASLVDIRRHGPLPVPSAIDPRAGLAMRQPFPGLPQGS